CSHFPPNLPVHTYLGPQGEEARSRTGDVDAIAGRLRRPYESGLKVTCPPALRAVGDVQRDESSSDVRNVDVPFVRRERKRDRPVHLAWIAPLFFMCAQIVGVDHAGQRTGDQRASTARERAKIVDCLTTGDVQP